MSLLNQGWLGTLIGLIGIALSIITFVLSKKRARPTFIMQGTRLIGKRKFVFKDVKVMYKNEEIVDLIRTRIIFWNSGNSVLKGVDFAINDPLKFTFDSNCSIFDVEITKSTRPANDFRANLNESNIINCSFDYLDQNDGVIIDVIHSGPNMYPEPSGTIRGIPEGIKNYGWVQRVNRIYKRPRLGRQSTIVIASSIMLIWSFITARSSYLENQLIIMNITISMTSLTLFLAIFTLYKLRRNYRANQIPKTLFIDDSDILY